jgi:hypothetical protein
MADRASELTRIPGPGEAGFIWIEQNNANPGKVWEMGKEKTAPRINKK